MLYAVCLLLGLFIGLLIHAIATEQTITKYQRKLINKTKPWVIHETDNNIWTVGYFKGEHWFPYKDFNIQYVAEKLCSFLNGKEIS